MVAGAPFPHGRKSWTACYPPTTSCSASRGTSWSTPTRRSSSAGPTREIRGGSRLREWRRNRNLPRPVLCGSVGGCVATGSGGAWPRQAPSRNPLEGGDGTETSQAATRTRGGPVTRRPGRRRGTSTTRGAVRSSRSRSRSSPPSALRGRVGASGGTGARGPAPRAAISRAQYDALVDLARKRALAFSPSETGQRARNRLRKRLDSWGVRTSVPARAAGAGQAHVLRLEGQFTVHLADGSPTGLPRRVVLSGGRSPAPPRTGLTASPDRTPRRRGRVR